MANLEIGIEEQLLFTPGPLTTSETVKRAMLRDVGSHDSDFINAIQEVREGLLDIAGLTDKNYEAILMQGSGTFGIEAVLSSFTPPNGKWLMIINGAYGRRMNQIAKRLNINTTPLICPENQAPDLSTIETALKMDAHITHVAVVHCETTSGIFNPIKKIGKLARRYGKRYFVDAMSSFGAVPIKIGKWHIDFLVSSANKCIESVPGFCFVLAEKSALLNTEGDARSISLDLFAQWKTLEKNGNFRFTPPTHTILAFAQALKELEEEGGVTGRAERYKLNHECLVTGMKEMGFVAYLKPALQGYIITTFYCPVHPNFDYKTFYNLLHDRGFVIYSGKVTDASCFRLGNIGRIYEHDVQNLLSAISDVLNEMDVQLTN